MSQPKVEVNIKELIDSMENLKSKLYVLWDDGVLTDKEFLQYEVRSNNIADTLRKLSYDIIDDKYLSEQVNIYVNKAKWEKQFPDEETKE